MTVGSRASVLLLIPVLVLGACGGSSKKVDPAADLALAKGAVFTAADLPGYTGKPHAASDNLPAEAKKNFAACLKVSTTIFDDLPGAQKADSPDFSKGNASASNSIEIDPKKSEVDTSWNQFSKPGVAPCLVQLFGDAIKAGDTSGATFGVPTVTRFDVGVGSRSVGYSVKITVSGGGQTASVVSDIVLVQRDRAGMTFEFSDIGTAVDRQFEIALAQKVYDRIGNKAS